MHNLWLVVHDLGWLFVGLCILALLHKKFRTPSAETPTKQPIVYEETITAPDGAAVRVHTTSECSEAVCLCGWSYWWAVDRNVKGYVMPDDQWRRAALHPVGMVEAQEHIRKTHMPL